MKKYAHYYILAVVWSFVRADSMDPQKLLNPNNAEIVLWHQCIQMVKDGGSSDWPYLFGDKILACLGKECGMHARVQAAIAAVQDETVGPVVINKRNHILSGHEYVAAALLYKKKIECTMVSDDDTNINELKLLQENGLDQKTMDQFVLEYIKLNTKCFTCIIWPKGQRFLDHIRRRFSSIGVFPYEKKFEMREYAPYLFIRQITNKKPRVDSFIQTYFRSKLHPVQIVLLILETDRTPRDVIDLKLAVRREVRYPFCMHIDDINQQGVLTCEMILNQTTHSFLNAVNAIPSAQYETIIANFLKEVRHMGGTRHDYCIVNFDTMLHSKAVEYVTNRKKLEAPNMICKNNEYTKQERDELLYNPDASFYYFYAKIKDSYKHTQKTMMSYDAASWTGDHEDLLGALLSQDVIVPV